MRFKQKAKILLIATVMMVSGISPSSASLARPFKVVIDPGHGGSDEGTVTHAGSKRITEKEITLKLSRQLAQQLRARGFFVALTRTQDREVSLLSRTALANRLEADVFISIHMNSTHPGASPFLKKSNRGRIEGPAEGIETYILNNATEASSRRLARIENNSLSKEFPLSPEQSDVALMLKELRLDGNLNESKQLACNIQSQLVLATSKSHFLREKRNRGVKQALFHVLLGADMPSVLVEAGFLNSAIDRAIALSQKGQHAISRAIVEAIVQYRAQKKISKQTSNLSKCKIN